jgi:hypothetical protein
MKIHVEFAATVPIEATEDHIIEWVGFCLGAGSMSAENPLSYDLVADFSSLIVDLL